MTVDVAMRDNGLGISGQVVGRCGAGGRHRGIDMLPTCVTPTPSDHQFRVTRGSRAKWYISASPLTHHPTAPRLTGIRNSLRTRRPAWMLGRPVGPCAGRLAGRPCDRHALHGTPRHPASRGVGGCMDYGKKIMAMDQPESCSTRALVLGATSRTSCQESTRVFTITRITHFAFFQ